MACNKTLPAHRLENAQWQNMPLTISPSHQPTGPIRFFNPTKANLRRDNDDAARLNWRSRDNRKGRHKLLIPADAPKTSTTPPSSRSAQSIITGLRRMLTDWNYWDISWLVAAIFTWGSIIWCINALFIFLPLVRPSTEFDGQTTIGGGVTAFIGATVFELGSVLLLLEAWNEKSSVCFGWAVEKLVDGELRITEDKAGCGHHHHRRVTADDPDDHSPSPPTNPNSEKHNQPSSASTDQHKWIWIPSATYFRDHLLHEIGFLASLSQFFGATVFWISGFTALPWILDQDRVGLTDGVFWTPQVVGGCGFIVSGALFTVETQSKWYIPAFGTLGWHIGFWNLVGGVGFTLCGALGYAANVNSGVSYESTLATFWGSWAFLIASVIQWYEAVNKFPVGYARPS